VVAVEQIHGVLGEIAHPDAAAEGHRALVWPDLAGRQLQQRGFARTVGAEHAPAFRATHPEIEPRVDRLAAIALVNLPEARHVIARARWGAEFKPDGLAAPGRFHP